jgi:hypothetical protein
MSNHPEYRIDMRRWHFLSHHYLLLLAIVLSSCGPVPTPIPFTPTLPQPTNPVPAATATPPPTEDIAQLIPAAVIRAYPGPEHYAGDILTFEIKITADEAPTTKPVSLQLDDNAPIEVAAELLYSSTILPRALDTSGLSGPHKVRIIATVDSHRIDEVYSFNVLPASERPAQEANAAWLADEIPCCSLHYISNTAAARDIDFIAEHFQQAAEDFSRITGRKIDPKLQVYLIDRIWGNGGFGGGGELVVSYTDRYYGPTVGATGLETLVRHEFTHAAGVGLAGDGIDFNYEGLAVYVAGGHYKPEPLAERGAALYKLGYYVPVGQYLEQHEVAYLYPAAMLTYISETYGSDAVWKFLGADKDVQDGQPAMLGDAIQSTFSISLESFDTGFSAWLQSHDPGQQLDDLRLTIELQDLRRQYQDVYLPPPSFIIEKPPHEIASPELLPILIRESHAPTNTAIELIIANAQKAIIDGDYSAAELLIDTIKEVLSTQRFENALAKAYLSIASMLAQQGYEVETLDLKDNKAAVQVTENAPNLITLELQKSDGDWQLIP